ncbi:MAG: DUF4965 domain-containing protein [Clostridia bacterium]|nr:DUF4965 domain-containing protein [Clostridia bacterium]
MNQNQKFRPVAIPLVTNDPYFSLWCFTDKLTDDHTRHWTGALQSMFGFITIDGEKYRFMGKTAVTDRYFPEGKALEQTDVTVNPTSTVYTFSHPACELRVTFLTPLLLDRPEVFSRPVSYIFYDITPREEGHTFSVYFDAAAYLCGDGQCVKQIDCFQEEGHVWMGNHEQKPLNRSGDNVRIDWGYLHLVHPNASLGVLNNRISNFTVRPWKADADLTQPVSFYTVPLLRATSEKLSDVFVLAYDDIKSIQYFHRDIDAYYKTVYGDFDTMLKVAVEEANELREICAKFDADLISKMEKITPEYAKLGALAYRQTVAAHKLCLIDGEMMFFSKENFSNGCMATLDVTYPSIPLYLIYNPELVRGMMRPILDYAKSEAWPYSFAPHDCGQYPLCNGQVYGGNALKYQMPVEECGNAILTIAAATRADGNRTMADENRELLQVWADYLVENGYNPENQLCTDDFAGHLAQNCNLSIKAIVALGAFGQLYKEEKYTAIAKDMAARWVKEAKKQNGKGWRLTFDREDTWSLKYNMVWDRFLSLGLFGEEVAREEIAVYTEKMNEYGVPLDSRANYTKLDWMAWTTVMADVPEYTEAVYKSMTNMTRDSLDRVPMTDWYDTVTARQIGFQARSVLGGFFINLLLNHPNFCN